MSKFNINNARLAIKGLFNLWVPVAVVMHWVAWDPIQVSLIQAASMGSVDIIFRVWQVGD